MSKPLEGQVAVVTGASRGIGRAVAESLGAAGASVVCVATSAERATPTAEAINSAGGKAVVVGADVSKMEDCEAIVSTCMDNFEKIDILVNNAGITRDNILLRMSEEEWDRVIDVNLKWDRVIDVNLKGTFNCVKAFARPMIKQRSGRIINISSVIGLGGNAGQANYAASKAGIIAFSKSVASELGSRGITCNVVAPGFIETDMTNELPEEMREGAKQSIPLKRLGTPEDIASSVLFLAGDGAAYVTGQVIVVDGGMTLGGTA
jgi:3-oxoacyl-[acyl-carrier protein] reductase